MKKIKTVLLLTGSCLCMGMFAQTNLTPAQKSFQTEIIEFLKEEGYLPTLSADNAISFKSEGKSHGIRIFSDSPFFVAFQRSGYTSEAGDSLQVNNAISAYNEMQKEMNIVKLNYTDKQVIFKVEQYTRSAEDFKYVFYKNLQALSQSEKEFADHYQTLAQATGMNQSSTDNFSNAIANSASRQERTAPTSNQNAKTTASTIYKTEKLDTKGTTLWLGRELLSYEKANMIFADRPDLFSRYQQAISKKNGTFFIIMGGALAGAGIGLIAANADEEFGANPATLGVVGLCAGGGSILIGILKKSNKRALLRGIVSDYNRTLPRAHQDNGLQLNLVASGNGVGLQLNF